MAQMQAQLPQLPQGWVWTRLGEIGEINPKSDLNSISGDTEVTFLPMKCVAELTGHIDLSCIERLSEVKKGYTPFRNGDILFAKITPCMENGKVAIARGLKNSMGFGSTEFHVIRLPESIPQKIFFFYLIQESLRKDAQSNMTGSAGQLRVPANYIRLLPFPLPPLAEQHRIVAKLEELLTDLDAGIASLRAVQAQLKRYCQAVLKYAFAGKLTEEWRKANKDKLEPAAVLLERIQRERGKSGKKSKTTEVKALPDDLPELPEGWVWTKLESCSEVITKGESPKWQGFKYVDNGTIFIRSENVLWGKINLANCTKIPEEFHKRLKRSQIKPYDVLINIVGASIGRCGVITSVADANINQAVALVRVNDALTSSYLLHWLLSSYVQRDMFSSKVETARANISLGYLNQLVVPLPPLAEQHQIVSEIERRFSVADAVERAITQSLEQAERLRQSILKRAFQGKLVPQDPNDEPAEKLLAKIQEERAKEPVKRKR